MQGLLVVVGVSLASCIKPQATASLPLHMPISAEVIYQSQQCNMQEPHASWISSQSQLQSLFVNLQKSFINNQTAKPPAIDFLQFGGLLVAMGQKNTGGYGLKMMADSVELNDKVLSVSLQWQEPKPGMIVIQALTSPCLLMKIPKGEYRRIEIKDQVGTIRLQVSL